MRNTNVQNQDGLTIISNEEDVKTYLGKDKTPENLSAPSEKSAKPISKAEERRRKKAEKEARNKEIEAMINGFLNGDDGVTRCDEQTPSSPQSLQSKRDIVTIMTNTENIPEIQDSFKSKLTDDAKGDSEDSNKSNAIPCSSEITEEETEKSDSLTSPDTSAGTEIPTVVDTVTTPTTPTEVTIVEESETPSQNPVSKMDVSPPKATRISAKMRKRSRDEFCDIYLQKCDTKFGKPITLEPELMERLYRVCLRTGNRKACPTYVVNNLLKEIMPILEDEAERW